MVRRLSLIAVFGLLTPSAGAQVREWNNPAGGCWCTPSNWSPSSLPTSANGVFISWNGTYTVRTAPSPSNQALLLSISNPDATLAMAGNESLTLWGSTHQIDGTLRIGDGVFGGPATVELFGASPTQMSGTGRIVLNAHPNLVLPFAAIRYPSRTLAMGAGLRLEGRGAVQTQLVHAGTIAPGIGPGGIGEFVFDALQLSSSSVLEFDIAGFSFTESDRITINSAIGNSAGTIRVRLAGGFVPPLGASFNLINGVLNTSQFTLDAPGFVLAPGGVTLRVMYVGVPCDPDVNADGNVDQDDVAYLVGVAGGADNPSGIDPDFNRDGNVDQDDVRVLVAVVAGAPCP